jgi:hypothetical protein
LSHHPSLGLDRKIQPGFFLDLFEPHMTDAQNPFVTTIRTIHTVAMSVMEATASQMMKPP